MVKISADRPFFPEERKDIKKLKGSDSSKTFNLNKLKKDSSFPILFPEEGHIKEWLVNFKWFAGITYAYSTEYSNLSPVISFVDYCDKYVSNPKTLALIKKESGIDLSEGLKDIKSKLEIAREEGTRESFSDLTLALMALVSKLPP